MRASVSSHGFTVVRRGYRAEQVDRLLSRLSAGRDEAWERVARLTVLAKEMEEKTAALRGQVGQLPVPTYEELGPRAQEILALAEAEAADLRDRAEAAANDVRQEAEESACALREAARTAATAVRADADAVARQREETTGKAAGEILRAARQDVKSARQEAVAVLKEARKRSAATLAGLERELAAREEAAQRELEERCAESAARLQERGEVAERRLAEAQRVFGEVRQAAGAMLKEAEGRGAELIAQASARAERVQRETRLWLREHEELKGSVRSQLERVRSGLSALEARDVGTVPGPAPTPGSEEAT